MRFNSLFIFFLDLNNLLILGINFDGKDDRKIVNFIPKGIANFFPNLKYLRVGDTRLKEIHQEDFKPFKNLTHVSFFYNKIEVIEEGLFDFNPLLEFVWFEKNEIKIINLNVFKNLKRLTTLDLRNNLCISDFADNDVKGVVRILKELEAKMICLTPEYILIHYPKLIERYQKIMEENEKSHVKLEISEIIIIVSVIAGLIIVSVIGVYLVKKDKKNKRIQTVNNQNYDLPKNVALPKPPQDFMRSSNAEVRYSVSPSVIDHTYETIREPGD